MTTSLPENEYQYLLDKKVEKIKAQFDEFELPSLSIYSSPSRHYRMRAEFRIWHNKEELYHVMYDPNTQKRVRIDSFPVASELINQAMDAIVPLLKSSNILRDKLFQIDYLSTLSNQLLITLIYHCKLGEEWIKEITTLKQALINQGMNVHIVGRASNQKICLDQDYIDEKLNILNHVYTYRQVENSFTQPNAVINIDMLTWAIKATKGISGDLLELYCGNGNFSIALAQNFNQVLATEVAKASVKAAQYNIEVNKLSNVNIIRLSAEEFTDAMNGVRTFKRLKDICLTDYQFNTILVDPPRSGLDENTLDMIVKYQTIIYISCNPLTLKDNLSFVCKTHKISQFAIFDQFPYTSHLEVGMVLHKKD
ncbi:tRNA (uridine(54)-C5)-methyltransferase TrmA [Orbus wheelerorum]|uniref:tRNA (uridine(54)-C5)-methyltransferase TrmA n=1 Tax=Orbus wheelerorum TaxID=3074111 RepID=UPI00370DA367